MPKRTHDGIKKRCGCGKRQWPKCSHPWWFGFHFNGKEHRHSLDKVALARGEHPPVSKNEAMTWRDRLRNEIRGGTFTDKPAAPAPVETRLTFGDVCDEYLKRHVRIPTRRPLGRREMEIHIALLRQAEIPAAHGATVKLETRAIDSITKADVEAVRAWRRQEQAAGKSLPGTKGGECGINRLLSRLRHVFSWSVEEGYRSDTPFKRGTVTVVKLTASAEAERTRRLEPGEEERLLQHAGPLLRALIVAALATGCRLGELLSLQWSQIRRDDKGQARWIDLEAAKTKTAEARTVPVGLRLRAELDMRRHAPDGGEHPPHAHVFGDEAGGEVKNIRRAWETAVLRANGHTPLWVGKGKLSPESRAALRSVNLHFHDLRREFACKLLESGADLKDVRDFLGHANITTTSRYLKSAPLRLERALARLEEVSADASAHHSHKPPSDAPTDAPNAGHESAHNRLN